MGHIVVGSGDPLSACMAERRRLFQFCIEGFQSVGRLFLELRNFVVLAAPEPEWRTVSRAPGTRSCRFEASEPIPFPGADSIFSSRCGAISRRLRFFSCPPNRPEKAA